MCAISKNFDCCPPFEPTAWDDKIQIWENKHFIKDNVFTLFYMPFNFGAAMKRLNEKVERATAQMPQWLCLSEHTSKWNMDLYLAVDREIPDAENIKLSGRFYSRIYEGEFNETSKWYKDFDIKAAEKGLEFEKKYTWYTTCPKCAKKYGHNYVVIIVKLK